MSEDPRWRPCNVPKNFALRLDLMYKTGETVVFVYDEMPSNEEQMSLMWRLQSASRDGKFVLYRTDRTDRGYDTIEVAPI
jgi:hypothetical protein